MLSGWWFQPFYFVVLVGIIIPNIYHIWKNKTCSKPSLQMVFLLQTTQTQKQPGPKDQRAARQEDKSSPHGTPRGLRPGKSWEVQPFKSW